MSTFIFRNVGLALSSSRTQCWSASSRRLISTSRALYGPKVVYLTNLSSETEVADLKELAEPFGVLSKITIPDQAFRSTRFANVEFEIEECAQKFYNALKNDTPVIKGRTAMARLVEEHQQTRMQNSPTNTIVFSNLPHTATIEEIRPFFSHLKRSSFKMFALTDRRGRPMIMVAFRSKEDAFSAMNEHKEIPYTLDGKPLSVHYSTREHNFEDNPPNRHLMFSPIDEVELRATLRPYADLIERIQILPSKGGVIIADNIKAANTIKEALGDKLQLDYGRPRVNYDNSGRPSSPRKNGSFGGDWGGGQRSRGYDRSKDAE